MCIIMKYEECKLGMRIVDNVGKEGIIVETSDRTQYVCVEYDEPFIGGHAGNRLADAKRLPGARRPDSCYYIMDIDRLTPLNNKRGCVL